MAMIYGWVIHITVQLSLSLSLSWVDRAISLHRWISCMTISFTMSLVSVWVECLFHMINSKIHNTFNHMANHHPIRLNCWIEYELTTWNVWNWKNTYSLLSTKLIQTSESSKRPFEPNILLFWLIFSSIFTLCYSIFILIFPDDTINMLFMLPFTLNILLTWTLI